MASKHQAPSIDTDKLSYEIFSILESKFLFGYDDQQLWIPKQISPAQETPSPVTGTIPIKNQRGKICVLSIDGGGMRNIISGKALAYLEQSLKQKTGDSNARIADFFDIAAGTGVGGIFTAMLFGTKDKKCPTFTAEETWRFVAEEGKKMFKNSGGNIFRRIIGGGRGGGGGGKMEKVVKEMFVEKNGRVLTLRDTLKPVLIPCYDLSSSAPFLFSRADALKNDSFDFRLWEVCRATSAEPGLVGPVRLESVDGTTRCVAVDGGVAMSNPTAAAITHVLHNKEEFPFVRGVENILVLSLGTGVVLEGGYGFEEVKGWKAKQWARPVGRICGDGSAEMVDQSVALAFGESCSSNYVRIQANGFALGRCGANVDSDPSPSNVKMLSEKADEMLKQKNVESVLFGGRRIGEQTNFEKLDWFAGELVLEHQRRSCRIAPTVAFKQATQKPT